MACGSRPEVGSSRIAICGALHEDLGEAEPLPHAAREGLDALLGDVGEPDALERLGDALVALGDAKADQPRRVARLSAAVRLS